MDFIKELNEIRDDLIKHKNIFNSPKEEFVRFLRNNLNQKEASEKCLEIAGLEFSIKRVINTTEMLDSITKKINQGTR